MRLWWCLGFSVLVLIGLLLVLVLHENPGPEPIPDTTSKNLPEPSYQELSKRYLRESLKAGSTEQPEHEKESSDPEKEEPLAFGKEFEAKWAADRKRLGESLHREMEELWFAGRRPRGDLASIAKLEKLLEDFPDTNRAGCVAFELGMHYLKHRGLNLYEQRKKAETYFRLVFERYQGSLCEYNANPVARSKLALAQWIYQYTEPGLALRLLEEIMQKHSQETDHLGQPLEMTARRLLEKLKGT